MPPPLKGIQLSNYRNFINKKEIFNFDHTLFKGKNAVGKTNLLESISFLSPGTGFRKDVIQNFIFKNSSIYLALNTKNESFGITLIEAINSGNIVISSDLAAFKDVLEESGIYYERNSYKSLVNLLTNTLKSDLHFIWEKQYECIQKYDIEKNMEHYVLLYSNN